MVELSGVGGGFSAITEEEKCFVELGGKSFHISGKGAFIPAEERRSSFRCGALMRSSELAAPLVKPIVAKCKRQAWNWVFSLDLEFKVNLEGSFIPLRRINSNSSGN